MNGGKDIRKLRGRAELRGIPLGEDCKRAIISTHEYGPEDDRKYCYGLVEITTGNVLEKCKRCKAFVDNIEPPTN